MKRLYISAYFLAVLVTASGQTKTFDTSKAKAVAAKAEIKPQIKLIDTLKIELSDKTKQVPIQANGTTQIVIAKEKDSSNNLKTLLPLISALTGLIVGFFINRFYEWYANGKKIKKSGKRWNIELKTLEEPLKYQIKSIEEFITSVAKREWNYDALDFMTTINGDRFSSLNKNDLMDYIDYITRFPWYKRAFMSKYKNQERYNKAVKISNHIHGFIDVLNHNSHMLNTKWDEFQDGFSATTKKLSQGMDTLNIQVNNLNFQIANDTMKIYQNSDYIPFFNLYFKFISYLNPNYNMHNLQNDFLYPAKIELEKLTKDDRILPILASISILFNDLRAINGEKDYVLDNMKELITRYNKSLESLPKIIEKLEGKSSS